MLEDVVKRSEFGFTREQRYTKVIYYYCLLFLRAKRCGAGMGKTARGRYRQKGTGPVQAKRYGPVWAPVRGRPGTGPVHFLPVFFTYQPYLPMSFLSMHDPLEPA